MEINHQRAKELGHSEDEIEEAETIINKQNLKNEGSRPEALKRRPQ